MDNQVSNTEQVETKRCSNCEREIELSKFRMHEIGCARNNYKCQICGDIVAKSEREEHEKEAHTKVQCQFCQIEFNKKDLENHEQGCFMRPKPCRFCEQIIKFEDYEKHIGYCGSKTFKCFECSHNVCMKDKDAHEYGGECQAFIEQDKQKKIDEEKRKAEELKKYAEKKRLEDEKQAKRLKERERAYKDNFDMEDIEDEIPSSVNQYANRQQVTNPGLPSKGNTGMKQSTLPFQGGQSSQQTGIQSKGGISVQKMGVGMDPLSMGRAQQQQQQQQQSRVVQQQQQPSTSSKMSTQTRSQVSGTQSKTQTQTTSFASKNTKITQNNVVLSNNRTGSKTNPVVGAQQRTVKQEEVKQPSAQLGQKQNKGPIVNNQQPQKNIFEKPTSQSKPLGTHQKGPSSKPPQVSYNEELDLAAINQIYDEEEAHLFQEKEYVGGRNDKKNTRAPVQQQINEDYPMEEQLIPGARQQFINEWNQPHGGDDFHGAGAYHDLGGGMNYGGDGLDQTMGADDQLLQQAIMESMKQDGAVNIEDEQLQRAIEESRKMYQ